MFELINVCKTYGSKSNRLSVLTNVNLRLPNKGFVSILGKSGSGKSTMLNLLTGIDRPSSGEVKFLNKNIFKFKAKEKKYYQNEIIGVLYQHFNLFNNLTALENVMLPALIKGINEKDAKANAQSLFEQYHLTSLMNQIYGTLSGGEKQRVALLRALINNPKVIIADEPTGALDSKNSVLIMEELKKLSTNRLVIVVSHNQPLIEKYEDYRINIANGKASELIIKDNLSNLENCKKRRINFKIIISFIKSHLRKHKTRNIINGCSIGFSSLCLLVSLGYIFGSSSSINNYQKQLLGYNYATIAKKTSVEVPDSPIIISKLTRPEIEEISFVQEDIPSAVVLNNYQTIFPSVPEFSFDTKNIDDVEFSPIYDFTLYQDLLVEGNMPNNNFFEAVVNQEFVKKFNYQEANLIGHKFSLSNIVEINNKNEFGKVIKDQITFNQTFTIVGVVKEFAYLNTPKVYYSYLGLEDLLSSTILENYSHELGREINVKEIVDVATADDPNSAYSYNIYVKDLNHVKKLYSLKEKYDQIGGYDITSNSYVISSSYSSMTNLITTSLIVFLVIALIGATFIIVITSYSNFTQNKKESATLSILGTDRLSIFSIYNFENLLIAFISVIVSLVLAFPVSSIINKLIENKFRLSGLIAVPYLSVVPLLIFALVAMISILATLLPFLYYEKGYVVEELKDE